MQKELIKYRKPTTALLRSEMMRMLQNGSVSKKAMMDAILDYWDEHETPNKIFYAFAKTMEKDPHAASWFPMTKDELVAFLGPERTDGIPDERRRKMWACMWKYINVEHSYVIEELPYSVFKDMLNQLSQWDLIQMTEYHCLDAYLADDVDWDQIW